MSRSDLSVDGKLKITKENISENFNVTKISAMTTGRRLDVGNLILVRQSDIDFSI